MIHYEKKFARRAGDTPTLDELTPLVPNHPRSGAALATLDLLSGGFSNTNARVTFEDGAVALFRHRARDLKILSIEAAVMEHASSVVATPRVLSRGRDWTLLEWIDGERVDALLEDSRLQNQWPSIAAACGAALAKIHTLQMPACGFFDERLEVEEALAGAGTGILDYIEQCCAHSRVSARLASLAADIRAHVCKHEQRFHSLDQTITLVHSDYNTKNMLAARDTTGAWKITAVLDWEFAFAGSPMMDLGNFLRFEHERPEAVAAAFVDSYERERGAPLHPEWRIDARLMDLASMLSFLTREMLPPRTEKTVLGVIERTLQYEDLRAR